MHPHEVLAVKMFASKVVMMREMREGSHDYDMMLNAFAFRHHGHNYLVPSIFFSLLIFCGKEEFDA